MSSHIRATLQGVGDKVILSRSRIDHPEGGQRRGKKGRAGQSRNVPHIPAFLRHAAPEKRLGADLLKRKCEGISRKRS
jgi:hypothetical protein